MAQLGPVQPPITGTAPTDVPGEKQISEAYTAVRDNGLPGGRGLVTLTPAILASALLQSLSACVHCVRRDVLPWSMHERNHAQLQSRLAHNAAGVCCSWRGSV